MKKVSSIKIKKMAAAVLSAVVVVSGVPGIIFENHSALSDVMTVSAATSTRKCYTIVTSNTPVYSNTGLTSKIGSIYPTDEITVNNVTNAWTDVTYPISGNKMKRGYIKTSAILTGVNGIATKTSTGKCTTYKRPGGSNYGYVAKGDKCVILGTSGNYVQIKYPVSSGYKYGFITSSDAKSYLGYGATPTPTPTSSTKYYVTTTAGLNLRSDATTGSSVILTMPYASEIQVYSINNGWAYCSYNGKKGYCSSSYISKNNPTINNTPSVGSIVSYSQKDGRWSNYSYGYSNAAKTQKATIGSGGCGVLSLTNAVANLNGNFIDPKVIADYSVKNGYRVNGVGTAYGLYRSFCNNRGSQYGIKYVGQTSSWTNLQNYVKSGNNAAIVHMPGHIMTIVKYDSSTQKYLLIDSYPSSNRGTSSGYAWKTKSQLSSLGVSADFYIIGKR